MTDIYEELVTEMGDPIVNPVIDRSFAAISKEASGRLTIEQAGIVAVPDLPAEVINAVEEATAAEVPSG